MLNIDPNKIAQVLILWAILFFPTPSLSAQPHSIPLIKNQVIQSSHYNEQTHRLWYLTRSEVGYFIGSKKHQLEDLSSFSDLFLDMQPSGEHVIVAGEGGVASYNTRTKKIKTISHLDIYGLKRPIQYALNLNVYNDTITFVSDNRIVTSNNDLTTTSVMEIPINGFSSKEIHSMGDDDYYKYSSDQLRAALKTEFFTIAYNVAGQLIKFDNEGESGEILISPADLPDLAGAYGYKLYYLKEHKRILVTTSKGLLYYDLSRSQGGFVPGTSGMRTYKLLFEDNVIKVTGVAILEYNQKSNVASIIRSKPKNILNIINAHGIEYLSTEYDGLITTVKDSPVQYFENAQPSKYKYTVLTEEDVPLKFTEEVVKYDDSVSIVPPELSKVWGHLEYKESIIFYNNSHIVEFHKQSRKFKLLKSFNTKSVYNISKHSDTKIFIAFKDHPTELYDLKTNVSTLLETLITNKVWANAPRVKALQTQKDTLIFRNSSAINLFNNINGEHKIHELGNTVLRLQTSYESEEDYSLIYDNNYVLFIDKKSSKIEEYNSHFLSPLCVKRTNKFIVEVNKNGDLWIVDRATKKQNLFNIKDTIYGSEGNAQLYYTCKMTKKELLHLSSDRGMIMIDLDKAYRYKPADPIPLLLNGKNQSPQKTLKNGLYLRKYVSSSPYYDRNLVLSTQTSDGKLHQVNPSSGVYELELNQLPYGNHQLKIWFTNTLTNKNYPAQKITIVIPTPYYFSFWFLLIYAAIILISIFAAYFIIKNNIHKKSQYELAKSKEMALNGYVHDAKSPVTSIIYTNELVSKGLLTKEQGYEQILSSSRMIEFVANNMLSINELNKSGGLSVKPNSYKYSELITLIQDAGNLFTQKKTTDVEFNVNGDPNDTIVCDMPRIVQVYINILSNAIKYSEKNSIIDVKLSLTQSGFVEIDVTDTGRGVPEAEITKITQLNYQASNKIHEGMGMGLYLVKSIVSACDGELNIRSEVGVGTTVSVSFPVKSTCIVKPSLDAKGNDVFPYKAILLEDDPILRKAMVKLFESEGMQIHGYGNSDDFFNSPHFPDSDIYITDHFIGTGDYTGLDVADEIIKHRGSRNVFALSDQVDSNIKSKYINLGCTYIEKTSGSFKDIYTKIVADL